MNMLIDLQTSPFDLPEEIRSEIEEVRRLGDTPEVRHAIETLEENLKFSEELHQKKDEK